MGDDLRFCEIHDIHSLYKYALSVYSLYTVTYIIKFTYLIYIYYKGYSYIN